MKKTRTVLLTSVNDKSTFYHASAPSMGLFRLQHYLQQREFPCDVLDLDLPDITIDDCLKDVEDGKYQIIGMSVTHDNMSTDLATLSRIRLAGEKCAQQPLIILGGQEATLNFQQWLHDSDADGILLGFAEKTLHELCERLNASPGASIRELLDEMPGVAYLGEDGKPVYRGAAPLTQELFRELSYTQEMSMDIPYSNHWQYVEGEGGTNMNFNRNKFFVEAVRLYTVSHCPRGCGFCQSQTFLPFSQSKKSRIIQLTASEVHDLILHHTHKYGAKAFVFSDDDFIISNREGYDRTFELCRLIVESKRNGELPADMVFNCQTRIASFLKRSDKGHGKVLYTELIDALKAAGFWSFGLGVETFSNRLLKAPSVFKVGISEEHCRTVLDGLMAADLCPQINIILFIPETTDEDLFHSMRISSEYMLTGCQAAVTSLMSAYPGSPAYSNKAYTISWDNWENPYNGKEIRIARHFIPNEPHIAELLHTYKDRSKEIENEFRAMSNWEGKAIPRPITGLSVYIALSELLNRPDQVEYFRNAALELLRKNDPNRHKVSGLEVRSDDSNVLAAVCN